jgi:transposase
VAEAHALQALAQRSTASTRAVAARSLVVRTLALHLLDLQERLHELEQALASVLGEDTGSKPLQGVPGLGPVTTPTIRAELGEVSRFRGVDQVIAYAGLEPRTRQSGAWVGQKRLVLSRARRTASCPLLGRGRRRPLSSGVA